MLYIRMTSQCRGWALLIYSSKRNFTDVWSLAGVWIRQQCQSLALIQNDDRRPVGFLFACVCGGQKKGLSSIHSTCRENWSTGAAHFMLVMERMHMYGQECLGKGVFVCVHAHVCVCFMYESNATAVFEALLMARPQSHLVDYYVKLCQASSSEMSRPSRSHCSLC